MLELKIFAKPANMCQTFDEDAIENVTLKCSRESHPLRSYNFKLFSHPFMIHYELEIPSHLNVDYIV